MKRILFVDDDNNILQGLNRMLRPMRKVWDITYTDSGEKALQLMADSPPFDAVVSDMRMPGMNGVEFLGRVMNLHPQVVRFGLSGYSDNQMLLQATNVTHQFLSKPIDPEKLKKLIDRALALRKRLHGANLQQALLKIGGLPSLPKLYQSVLVELQASEPAINKIGQIISHDVSMSAKVLQITNSVYMGIRKRITSPAHAVSLLGLETIKSIILVAGAFTPVGNQALPKGFDLDALWQHSFAVAEAAQKIARQEGAEQEVCDDAFTAGLLHAVGQLILATSLPELFAEVLTVAEARELPLTVVEQELVGSSHAEIGGCLLELWGLPDPIVEAVTFHHAPQDCPYDGFSPLLAVHVANCLQSQPAGERGGRQPRLAVEFLARLGFGERLPTWRQAALGGVI